jgi:sucrose-6-phosphate hydrolase SacC (GH32 family)
MGRGIPAPIRRSVSNDGYHFEKDRGFGFTVSDKYHKASARDPKVIKGEDGLFHMLLTTSLIKEGKGCLAHYVSEDMEKWEDFGEPIYISPSEEQPECPDYFKYNGKYYLIFSLNSKAHYMLSDKPFENFVMPDDPIIPCASVPKCAEWNGRLIFAGYKGIGGYGGSMTFRAAIADENGELLFEEL